MCVWKNSLIPRIIKTLKHNKNVKKCPFLTSNHKRSWNLISIAEEVNVLFSKFLTVRYYIYMMKNINMRCQYYPYGKILYTRELLFKVAHSNHYYSVFLW